MRPSEDGGYPWGIVVSGVCCFRVSRVWPQYSADYFGFELNQLQLFQYLNVQDSRTLESVLDSRV